MSAGMEELHAARMNRYAAAMRNGMPDRVSPRPFAAGIAARRAGFTCQQVAHDYDKAFAAVIHRCKDHAWDAVAPNMVYAWTCSRRSARATTACLAPPFRTDDWAKAQ